VQVPTGSFSKSSTVLTDGVIERSLVHRSMQKHNSKILFSSIFFSYKTKVRIQLKRGHGCFPKQSVIQSVLLQTFWAQCPDIGPKTLYSEHYLLRRSPLSQTATVPSTNTSRLFIQDATPLSVSAPIKDRPKVS
jgi:hypothetical protein